MIREERFVLSRRPYAVDLATVTGDQHERGDSIAFSGTVNAVWFRRQDGVTRACVGTLMLWAHYLPERLDLDDPAACCRRTSTAATAAPAKAAGTARTTGARRNRMSSPSTWPCYARCSPTIRLRPRRMTAGGGSDDRH